MRSADQPRPGRSRGERLIRTVLVLVGIVGCGRGGTLDAVFDASVSVDADAADAGLGDAEVDAGEDEPEPKWRSVLFPVDWKPLHAGGAMDSEGRFLPDVSTAGWHRGEERPPVGEAPPVVTVTPGFDDGVTDATGAIQNAIDIACVLGGGVAFVPAGTYRLTLPRPDALAALSIRCSRVVLRGDGPSRTRLLFDDPTRARNVAALEVRGQGLLRDGAEPRVLLSEDVAAGSRTVRPADVSGFSVGQYVIVRNSNTADFRVDHQMDEASSGLADLWTEPSFWGLAYPRRIERIDGNEVTLDAPVHHPLRTRDAARVEALPEFIREVGLESFAIGMVENRTSLERMEPESDDDYLVEGLTGYEVNRSRAIEFDAVHDAWIHDVDTFMPAGNSMTSAHVLSNGFLFEEGAFRVTVTDCQLARPQYRGGGGNGYLFQIQGHEILIVDGRAERGRHGVSLNHAASGNVLLRTTLLGGRLSDDMHRFLATGNLYDGTILDGSWLQTVNRGTTSGGAGFTGSGNVFWRTHVRANHLRSQGCALESAQWGHGYLIGSSAERAAEAFLCPMSFTNSQWAALDSGEPLDFVEGEGIGEGLEPRSLHEAQLAQRCAREGRACVQW